ncbi:type I-G CRISPR-associated protein Cas8g1/Csx17 [Desulfobulbus propionicus]
MPTIKLPGCRHDILGHYLKGIGLLRVLAKCAAPEHRDPEAEGFWRHDDGAFYLCSEKYGAKEKLSEFFEKYYMPTPVFAEQQNANTQTKCRSTSLSLTDYLVAAAKNLGVATGNNMKSGDAISVYRESHLSATADVLDAITLPYCIDNKSDNPLFLSKGRTSGVGHVWSSFGEYVDKFEKLRSQKNKKSFNYLFSLTFIDSKSDKKMTKGKGTPFFPDAIKSYNIGSGWVEEKYPFSSLDYILAVEGAFVMRGSVTRTLGSNTRRFAAFPFVFDAGEDLVDDSNKFKGTSSALWFPIWGRPATYSELSSFISDAQARLPKKDVRYSSEFLRALYSQGVDAGFSGWQEFRFRMRGSRVPWITTGNYCETKHNKTVTILNRALAPIDKSRFIDHLARKGNDADSHTRPIRAEINAAIENAAISATADNCLEILCAVFSACKKIAISKSFREKARLQRPVFFEPLPMLEWNELLKDLESIREFDIARAVASIVGLRKQERKSTPTQKVYSKVQPLFGSLLPLNCGRNGWYLPNDDDRSKQAVWSGVALCHDLVAVLQRRYMDSSKDDYPALQAVKPARLENIIAFLNGELDDAKIARWIEALSLIGWHFEKQEDALQSQDDVGSTTASLSVPLPYAALRTLVDLECAFQQKEEYKHRRSSQPIGQLCQCSAGALAQATQEALRWISIWGVRNPWQESRQEREILKGAYVVNLDNCALSISENLVSPERVAAAVCIPLCWKDRWQLHQIVTLPISV